MLPGQDVEQAAITGTVLDDETGLPLEFANVSVLDPENDQLLFGGVTDLEGRFEIGVSPGVYKVRIDFLSYKTRIMENVVVSEDQPIFQAGTIRLGYDAQVIEGVEVIGEKSQLQMGLDKRVFNVGKDVARTGGSAADLLDNIPSVAVDIEGNVSLRGSSGVRILINGRPSGLVGIGDNNGLQLLQANMIDRIEIITNPSAKYEAEGSAGIINIILKKEQEEGVNGSFDLNTGFPQNYGAAANVNLRRRFYNLFGNFGVNYRERLGGGYSNQQFFLEDSTYFTDLDRDYSRNSFGFNAQAGADFFLDPTNTITTSFLYRKGWDENLNETIYRDYDENRLLSGISSRVDEEAEDEYTLEYNLNYRKTFAEEGRQFTVDLQYQDNRETENSDIREMPVDEDLKPIPGDPLFQRSTNEESEDRLLLQADYVHPFSKEGKLEAGYRSTFRIIDNTYQVEELNDGGDWELLPAFSNVFDYNEYIHALYASAGNKFGRIALQGGLRVEYSDIRTELRETAEVNDRNYLNLFPSVYLGYEFPGDQNVQVSYSRRIRRPRFWDLNPFFSFSDNRNIRTGNPNLDPELTSSYEISYLKYWDKVSVTSSLYYRHTTDVVTRITTVIDDSITLSRPENLLEEDNFGLEFIASADVDKWWRLNGSLNFFRSITDGGNLGEEFSADTYSWTGRFNSQMTFWKKLQFQLMFNYRGPQVRPQGERKAYFFMDTAFSIDILDGNGTLELNIRDVFNSRRYRYITDIDGLYETGSWRRSTTTVLLGFNYRLNQKKKRGRDRGDRDFDEGDVEF